MDELKREAARPAKIVVIGEILVEIVADTIGDGFREPIALTGPYPSGAPAIFADQAARMGQPCAIISAVGTDDFGRVNLDRLQADRVDIVASRWTATARPAAPSCATARMARVTSSTTSGTPPAGGCT
jgi:sugar/nucleoside kinase (ribokinase family)